MYIVDTDTFYIEVPKTATSAFCTAIVETYPPHKLEYNAHIRMSEIIKILGREPTRSFGMIRDPRRRLVSSVNYCCFEPRDIDSCFDRVLGGLELDHEGTTIDIVRYFAFAPQHLYFDAGHNVEVYPFENMGQAAQSIGWEGPLPVVHESPKRFTQEVITGHRLFEQVLATYSEDQRWYAIAKAAEAGFVNAEVVQAGTSVVQM